MPLIDQWQGFTGLPDFSDPPAIPTDLKALFDFLASRAIPRYASVAARDAELTSPTDGQMAWVDATATLYVCSGGGWQTVWTADNDTGWVNMTMSNGWNNGSAAENRVAVSRVGRDVCLAGETWGGTAGATAFTLPEQFRPTGRIYGRVQGGSGVNLVTPFAILPTGEVSFTEAKSGSPGWNLRPISWRV